MRWRVGMGEQGMGAAVFQDDIATASAGNLN